MVEKYTNLFDEYKKKHSKITKKNIENKTILKKEEENEINEATEFLDENPDYVQDGFSAKEIKEKINSGEISVGVNRLGALLSLEEDMYDKIRYIKGDHTISLKDNNDDEYSYIVPRFGLLSILASKTSYFMFGNDTLLGKKIKTACTDGINIFINDAFWKEMMDIDKIENEAIYISSDKTSATIPLILHELSHMVADFGRMQNKDTELSNIAFDLRMHNTFEDDFSQTLKVSNYFKSLAIGFKDDEKKAFRKKSPEQIYEILEEEFFRKKQEQQKNFKQAIEKFKEQYYKSKNNNSNPQQGNSGNQQNNNSNPQQGNSGNQQNNNSNPQQGNSGNQQNNEVYSSGFADGYMDGRNDSYNKSKKNASYKGGRFSYDKKEDYDQGYKKGYDKGLNANMTDSILGNNNYDDVLNNYNEHDDHILSQKEISEILKEMGASEKVFDDLNYPKNEEELADVEKRIQEKLESSFYETNQKYKEYGIDPEKMKIPGSHVYSQAKENIMLNREAKLTFIQKINEKIWGSGMKVESTDIIPSPLFYCEDMTEMLGIEYNEDVFIPVKSDESIVCIVDTSGSMGAKKELKESISEILALKDITNTSNSARDILIYFADTIVRGEPIEINAENVDSFFENGMNVVGRGGTDLIEPIEQVLKHEKMKEKKVKSIIYFSDLGCSIPNLLDFSENAKVRITGKDKNNSVDLVFVACPNEMGFYNYENFKNGVKDFADTVKLKEGEVIDLSEENVKQKRFSI